MIKKSSHGNGNVDGSGKGLPTQGDRHGVAAEDQEKINHEHTT